MVIEPIARHHNRIAFTCGNDKLDKYIHEHAYQTKRKGLAATFVATDPNDDPARILGYYSLSNFLIEGIDIPEAVRRSRGIPMHSVAATLLGRLAVDRTMHGRGVGKRLVADALKRAYGVSAHVGSTAVVVDAIDQKAVAFSAQFGFLAAQEDDLRLFLMMDTVARLIDVMPAPPRARRVRSAGVSRGPAAARRG